jgi:predicted RNA-binding protein YlxR (DUF448 family)
MTQALPEPERTCIGCRRRAVATELARFALRDGRVSLWGRGAGRPRGRGAALHPDAACLRAALRAGAFARAFRGPVGQLDEADLLQQLTAVAAALRSVNRKKP